MPARRTELRVDQHASTLLSVQTVTDHGLTLLWASRTNSLCNARRRAIEHSIRAGRGVERTTCSFPPTIPDRMDAFKMDGP